jgi:hypothetical protein
MQQISAGEGGLGMKKLGATEEEISSQTNWEKCGCKHEYPDIIDLKC